MAHQTPTTDKTSGLSDAELQASFEEALDAPFLDDMDLVEDGILHLMGLLSDGVANGIRIAALEASLGC